MTATSLDDLRAIVGPRHVHTEGDLSAWTTDWRKRYFGRARAVVRPASTDEVARVVQWCHRHRVGLVPQGGNTGLVGGGVPDTSGQQIVLNLTRLNRVRQVDVANLTLTAEAGCVLQQVQDLALEHGLLFPLSLASEGSCTIGGNLATNAGGTQVLRYGNARDLCLGLEVVTAEGVLWNGLTGLRKDNTGYDLRNAFVGSEGTLGVITAATLKLFPRPAAQRTAMAACATMADCVSLLAHAQRRLGSALTGFEVMERFSLALVLRHFSSLAPAIPQLAPWHVLLEISDAEGDDHAQAQLESTLFSAMDAGLLTDATVAQSLAQSRTFWHVRESIPLAQAEEGLNIKHDISLPISRIPEFVERMSQELGAAVPGVRLVTFGHLGDGNLHYNVQAPAGRDPAAFLHEHESSIHSRVYDAVSTLGGSFSAEHGIGALKVEELASRKDPVALRLMGALKTAWDPLGILNPNRVLHQSGRP